MQNIFQAYFRGEDEKIFSLINSGTDINTVDQDKRTLLINSVINCKESLTIKLLQKGANPNIQDYVGFTALHYAAQNYSYLLCQILLEHKAEVDIRDMYGNTPLFRAVYSSRGEGEVIQLLLFHGADKHAKNHYGVSPYDLANKIANYDSFQYLK